MKERFNQISPAQGEEIMRVGVSTLNWARIAVMKNSTQWPTRYDPAHEQAIIRSLIQEVIIWANSHPKKKNYTVGTAGYYVRMRRWRGEEHDTRIEVIFAPTDTEINLSELPNI